MGEDVNLERSLGRIEGQNEQILEMLRNDRDRLNDHSKRITSVERKIYAIWFVGPVLVAVVGFYQKIKGS